MVSAIVTLGVSLAATMNEVHPHMSASGVVNGIEHYDVLVVGAGLSGIGAG